MAFTAPPTITNEARLVGGGGVTPGNNEASDVADIAAAGAEITFVKTHVGDFVRGQLEAEFVLLVSNIGDGPASGSTRIVDVVPDVLTVQDASGDGWQCDVAGQVVTCSRGDDLPASESFPPLSITVSVPPDGPDSIVNTATLSGTIVDQDIVVFTPPVDIVDPLPVETQVTKTVDQSILRIGDEPIFTLGIENPSRFALSGVTLLDTLPPGFIFVPGSGVMRTIDGSGSTVTTPIEPTFVDGDLLFSIGQLTPGSRVEIDYVTAVGPSVRPGTFETTVVGTAVSPLGERVTTVPVALQVRVAGSSFSLTQLLIGRVFEDSNRNGTFDSGEPGIANVRVVTASGLSATTDALGQYNLPSLAAGSTLIAVDPSTIPDGFSLPDGESPLSGGGRLLRTPLQGGSLLRQNFGLVRSSSSAVRAPSVVRAAPLAPSDVVPLAPSDVVVSETGTTDTFRVMLSAQPATDVVMTVASGDTGEATVSPTSVTFTTATWNSPQTVTVTGVGDNLMDGTQTTPITVSVDAANSDDGFDQLPDQTFNVSTTDEDSAGFTVTDSRNPSVSETETTDTLTLVLDAQPAADVVLTVASGDTGEATVGPASLTFTPANWNTGQAVTVTGVDDTLVDGTQMTTLIVSVDDANSDDAYDPVADQTVSVSTTDDDRAGFAVTAPGATVNVADADDVFADPPVALDIELERNSMTAGGRDRQLVTVTALNEAGEPGSEAHLLLSTTLGMLAPPASLIPTSCAPHASAEEQPALFRQLDLVTQSGVAYACLVSGAVPGDARVDVVDLGDDTLMAFADVGFDLGSRPPLLVALGEVGVGLSSPTTGSSLAERVDGQATVFYQDSLSTHDLITVAIRSKQSVNRATGSSGLFELDPLERLYPVMGDASTRAALAQSNSRLFARYDRGRSYALFGDLRGDRATLDRSGLLEFSRNVTGFRVHLESEESGHWFQGQVSQPRTAYTREVVTALVGTAIRLSHPQVVPGTEVVTIEVRDRRNPERTLSRETLVRNVDYSLEIESGLLLLKRGLPFFAQTLALVDVVVTYEYETSGLDSTVYLSRGSVSLDAIGLTLGGSVMVQREGGSQFAVGGVEVEQALFGAGLFRAVMPVSRGRVPGDVDYSVGTAPGVCCASANDRDGMALRMELEQPLFNRGVVLRGRYASTDQGFLNPYGQMTVPGQRFGSASVDTRVADTTRFTVGFEVESNRNGLVDNTRQTVGARVEHQVGDVLVARAGLDGRWFDDSKTMRAVRSRLLSAGLDWSPVERLRTSITREQNLGDADPTYPDQTTFGIQVTMTPGNELYVMQRFSSAPIIPISGVEAGGFSSSPLSTRETAVGVASRLGRYTSLNNRYKLESTINGTDSFAVLGLLTSIPVRKGLALDWSVDHGLHLAGQGEGYVGGAFGIVYSKNDDLRATARYELRRRAESEHIVSAGAIGRLTSHISMLARYRRADIATAGTGRLSEGQVSVAVRPRQSDRVAFLFSYEQGRSSGTGAFDVIPGRTDQLSMDGYALLRPGLESYTRWAAVRLPAVGGGTRGTATFFQTRLQQSVTRRFDVAAEVRLVRETALGPWQEIFAAELGAWLSRDFRVGIGYSSRGFNTAGSMLNSTASRGGTFLVLSSRLSSMFDLMGRGKEEPARGYLGRHRTEPRSS